MLPQDLINLESVDIVFIELTNNLQNFLQFQAIVSF